jgi:hypothetical protein
VNRGTKALDRNNQDFAVSASVEVPSLREPSNVAIRVGEIESGASRWLDGYGWKLAGTRWNGCRYVDFFSLWISDTAAFP